MSNPSPSSPAGPQVDSASVAGSGAAGPMDARDAGSGPRGSAAATAPGSGGGASADPAEPPSPVGPTLPAGTGGEKPPPVLKKGDRGPEVERLRRLLGMAPLAGDFDGAVEYRVKLFQRQHGIKDDPPGVYGPSTRNALEATRSPEPGDG